MIEAREALGVEAPSARPLLWCHATRSSPLEGTATGLSSAVEAIGAGIVTLLKRGCGREARDALRGVALNACIVLAAMLTHMGPSSLGVGNS